MILTSTHPLSGHIIIDESVSSYTNYEPETSGIENLKLKWTVTVTEDTEGDVGIWNGSLVLNGSPASNSTSLFASRNIRCFIF